jgi:hypothetical protein
MLTEKKNGKGSIYFIDQHNVIVSKICTKCNEVKTINEFGVRKSGLGGKDSTCKSCAVKRSIANYNANKEPHLERARKQQAIKRQQRNDELGPVPIWRGIYGKRNSKGVAFYENQNGDVMAKCCTKCAETKEIDSFATLKIGLGGRVSVCKDCRVREYELNREHEIERVLKHQQDNPEKAVLRQNRRRARRKSLPNDFTNDQMAKTLELFGGCALTGEVSDLHWDHVIPLAINMGGTTFGNMIPLRSDLNTSKSDANIFEWFERNKERFNLDQERFDRLINWLASVNGMTTAEYRSFVDECFDNRRKEAI